MKETISINFISCFHCLSVLLLMAEEDSCFPRMQEETKPVTMVPEKYAELWRQPGGSGLCFLTGMGFL